jgi:hypothetical protein
LAIRRYNIDPVISAIIPLVGLGSDNKIPESCSHDSIANMMPKPDNNSQSSL